MGRRKIEIKRIDDDKSRTITFTKRKLGLMKKGMELSVLCDCDVNICVRGEDGKLFVFSSLEEKSEYRKLNKDCQGNKVDDFKRIEDINNHISIQEEKEKRRKKRKTKPRRSSSQRGRGRKSKTTRRTIPMEEHPPTLTRPQYITTLNTSQPSLGPRTTLVNQQRLRYIYPGPGMGQSPHHQDMSPHAISPHALSPTHSLSPHNQISPSHADMIQKEMSFPKLRGLNEFISEKNNSIKLPHMNGGENKVDETGIPLIKRMKKLQEKEVMEKANSDGNSVQKKGFEDLEISLPGKESHHTGFTPSLSGTFLEGFSPHSTQFSPGTGFTPSGFSGLGDMSYSATAQDVPVLLTPLSDKLLEEKKRIP